MASVTACLNGTFEWYYGNGQLRLMRFYVNGERDGVSKSYYDNGQLKSKYTYKDGVKQ